VTDRETYIHVGLRIAVRIADSVSSEKERNSRFYKRLNCY